MLTELMTAMRRSRLFVVLGGILCVPVLAAAKSDPMDVSGCDLARRPKAFDGKRLRVRGTLSVEFEDFTLSIPNCDTQQGIWLTFGGDVPGVVASTFNDTVRVPGNDIKIGSAAHGIKAYGIRKDISFWRLYALIAARHGDKPDYRVTATLTGVFLAGSRERGGSYGGYGHLGCCALFVITQVSDVESAPPANLNIHGVVIGVDGQPARGLTVIDDIVGGYPPGRRTTVTDNQGRFAFSNSGRQLRIENPDYRPLALAVETGGPEIRVKLEPAKLSDWVIHDCTDLPPRKRVGFAVHFALPENMEAQPLHTIEGPTIFIHAHGRISDAADLIVAQVSDGNAAATYSLDSEWFEERWIKDATGKVLGMDARAKGIDGRYRRSAVFLARDAASYRLAPGKAPKALDEIIDSACVAKGTTR